MRMKNSFAGGELETSKIKRRETSENKKKISLSPGAKTAREKD